MRVSFDIDDTLRMHGDSVENDPNCIPLLLRFVFRERFRIGTRELLQKLNRLGHEICIYTTSARSTFYIRWWFRFYGIKLSLIVNYYEHERVVRQVGLDRAPSKNPAKFGIDLHVDDLPGVAIEGEKFEFNVLIIDTEDQHWAEKVTDAIILSEQVAASDR